MKLINLFQYLTFLFIVNFIISSIFKVETNGILFISMVNAFIVAFSFLFNFITRRSLKFEKYFTSKHNLFTAKNYYSIIFDLPKDVLFEKFIEVINNSKFKLKELDEAKYKILALSSVSFFSWGENLYINFDTKESLTIMNFCSTTFFQVFSLGKNEQNFEDLMAEFEKSLIV